MLGASDNGRKINIWSTNKYPNDLNTAVSVKFSVQSELCTEEGMLNVTETAVCNSFEYLLVLQTLIFLPLILCIPVDKL